MILDTNALSAFLEGVPELRDAVFGAVLTSSTQRNPYTLSWSAGAMMWRVASNNAEAASPS